MVAWLMAATTLILGSCTTTDDTVGSSLVPGSQQMKVGFLRLSADGTTPRNYIESRLFMTDSIKASNITYGYMGTELNDTTGERRAAFLTQMVSYYIPDEGYFGYKPVFDSAQLELSISTFGRDTVTEQTFGVYEILSNAYINEKPLAEGASKRDSTFYLGFDPMDPNRNGDASQRVYDPQKMLFSFTLGGNNGPATTAVTLKPTADGLAYIRRLMLQEGKYKEDYSIYSSDSLEYWVEEFRGLYIRPESPVTESGKGSIYATDLASSALTVYGRNHSKDDPSLIQDTLAMIYYFYLDELDAGNLSVNVIRHDYSKATSGDIRIDAEEISERNENRPINPKVFVEGMGGAVTELTFTEEFFKALDREIERENAVGGKEFASLAFSQVQMEVFFTDSNYDWTTIDPTLSVRLIDEMNAAPARLGLYTDYKALTAVSDYNYAYEANYDTTLDYGGYINRSRGAYVMNITGYIQQLWNSYTEEKQAAAKEGREVNMDNVKNRRAYLGLEAYSLYTSSFAVLQGGATGDGEEVQNNAPISFNITYNFIK